MKLLCIYLLILPAALLGYGFIADTPVKTVNQILSNNSQEITPCTVRAMSNSAYNFLPLVALAAAAELVVALAEGSAIAAATAVTVNNPTTAEVIKEILVPAQAAGATTAASAQKAIAPAVQAPAQMVAQSTTIAKPLEPVCRAAEERLLASTLTMPKTLSSSPSSVATAQVIQVKRTGLWTSIKAAACAIASTAKKAPTHAQQFAVSHPYVTAAAVTATVGAILYSRYLKRSKQRDLALQEVTRSECPCHNLELSLPANFQCPPFEELLKEFGQEMRDELLKRRDAKITPYNKHGTQSYPNNSKRVDNDRAAFPPAFLVKGTSGMLVSITAQGTFALYNCDQINCFHGHERAWKELPRDVEAILRKKGFVKNQNGIIDWNKWYRWLCFVAHVYGN